MATAYTISVSLTAMLPYQGVAPNITFPLFNALSVGALLTSSGSRVSWSPFLSGNLSEWEAYVQMQSFQDPREGGTCYVCSRNYGTVGSPEAAVQIISNETFRSGVLEMLGLGGLLNI
jgi:hypothetical protein